MKATKIISRIYLKSRNVVSLVILTILGFFSLIIFISISYSNLLSQQEIVLNEAAIESKKMLINSKLMELARKRTRLTSEILVTKDYFKKDELNMELESYAGAFSKLRSEILTQPLSDEEVSALKKNDVIISKILPAQRSATELAMSHDNEKILLAQDILYKTVLPGQNELINSFGYLVNLEQNKISNLTEKSRIYLKKIKKNNITTAALVSIISMIFSIIVVLRIRKIQLELRIYSKTLLQINESLETQVEKRTEELSELNSILKERSERDELTMLYNRRKFNICLDNEYKRVNRDNSLFSLLLIDIDYFKAYNDGYGHQKGDQCLASVASIMKNCLPRSIDFIARYGGEEFVIILPSTDMDGALKVAEIIRNAVFEAAIPHKHSKSAPFVSISQGVTTYNTGDSLSIEEIIENADVALYKAKTNGRNRVESKLSK